MKKDYLKTQWLQVLVTIMFVVTSIVLMDTLIIVVAVIFIIVLINNYRRYDVDEHTYDGWWNKLDKEEKKKIHSKKEGEYL